MPDLSKIAEAAHPLMTRLHTLVREKAVLLKELHALQKLCTHPDRGEANLCPDCGKAK